MLSFDADPVLAEARQLRDDRRLVRRALGTGGDPDLRTELHGIDARLAELLADDASRAAIESALDERARVLRIAVAARRETRARDRRRDEADAVVARAISAGRPLTRGERARVDALRANPEPPAAEEPGPARFDWRAGVDSVARRDAALAALGAARLADARAQLREGLLRTEQMRGIIAEALPALRRGDPVLLLGETGGAKTALAEHLSRAGMGRAPELVSGYGDITGAQVIGAHELRAAGGATVSAFVPGPLLRAMTEGRPIILDEVNAMPPEFLKRLNRILQLRPGDAFGVQEDAGRELRIAPGFAILATANEQTPHRYRGLERLSAELVNRFGANAYRVHYPDAGLPYDAFPRENALIAAAAVCDARGELPAGLGLDVDAIARVARAAFISQQVFSGANGEGFGDYLTTERELDGRPGLEEHVLAPRTLVAILQKVVGAAGEVSLERALARFVEGVMHREDRRVLALILSGQGFAVA